MKIQLIRVIVMACVPFCIQSAPHGGLPEENGIIEGASEEDRSRRKHHNSSVTNSPRDTTYSTPEQTSPTSKLWLTIKGPVATTFSKNAVPSFMVQYKARLGTFQPLDTLKPTQFHRHIDRLANGRSIRREILAVSSFFGGMLTTCVIAGVLLLHKRRRCARGIALHVTLKEKCSCPRMWSLDSYVQLH